MSTPYSAFPNRFRQDLIAGKRLIGCWASLGSPITTEVLGEDSSAGPAKG